MRVAPALLASRDVGRFRLPPILLLVVAAVGAVLLVNVAVVRWAVPADEHAYWLAARRLIEGQPLYDPTATPVTPYAYWYPPVLAQVLVPVALVLSGDAFNWAWIGLLLGCLLWMARWRPLVALAFVAFPPVAVELWFRNVHLVLAVLLLLSLRWPPPSIVAASSIKLSPGLAIGWLAARGRWRAAGLTLVLGAAVLAVSVVLSPQAWSDWIAIALSRGPGDVAGFLPVPFAVRLVIGAVITVAVARLRSPWAEVGLVIGVTVALPTLWFTALSLLIACVPAWEWHRRRGDEPPAVPAA